jgi:hypothetical protein
LAAKAGTARTEIAAGKTIVELLTSFRLLLFSFLSWFIWSCQLLRRDLKKVTDGDRGVPAFNYEDPKTRTSALVFAHPWKPSDGFQCLTASPGLFQRHCWFRRLVQASATITLQIHRHVLIPDAFERLRDSGG